MLPLAAALQAAAARGAALPALRQPRRRDPCSHLPRPAARPGLICVVEGVAELWALERAHAHRGLYHVLGGTLSALGGIGPEDLAVQPLLARIAAQGGRCGR